MGSDLKVHKFKPERTNNGYCFSDCSCGWSGGVYRSRADAKEAYEQHSGSDEPKVDKSLKAIFLIGPPAKGMSNEQAD